MNAQHPRADLDGRYRSLLEAAPDAMVVVNQAGEIVLVNVQAEKQFGYSRDELLGKPVNNLIPEGFADRLRADGRRFTAEPPAQRVGTGIELTGRRKSGGAFPIEMTLGSMESASGILVTAVIRDISTRKKTDAHLLERVEERKIIEEALFVEKERAEVTLDCIGDAVLCTDVSGNVTFLNVVAETLTGWPRQEAAGRPLAEVFRIVDATSGETIPDPMERAVARDRIVHLPTNTLLIRRDGLKTPIEDSASPIHDREGKPSGAVIIFRDVTAARAMALQLTHLAQHDYLTGLPNRMLLNDRISQATASARRHRNKLAVLFLDLDGFKKINDSLGHSIGDAVLQAVGRCLVKCVRESDTVSRQGGDEFVVLLSEMEHAEYAATTARRMLQTLAEVHSIDEHELHLTASIGVGVYPDDGGDAETLVKSADTAMYQAKENGRNGYQCYNSTLLEPGRLENVRAAFPGASAAPRRSEMLAPRGALVSR